MLGLVHLHIALMEPKKQMLKENNSYAVVIPNFQNEKGKIDSVDVNQRVNFRYYS